MIRVSELHEFDTIRIYQLQRGHVREPIRWENLTGLVTGASNVAIVAKKKLRKWRIILRGFSDVPKLLSRYS